MLIDFETMTPQTISGFKGGEGQAAVRKFDDPRMGAVVHITLPQGASIGQHTHMGNCEVVYVLTGDGTCFDGDAAYPLHAGMCHYCPEGCAHSIVNTGDAPLQLLGVLPNVR